MSARLDYIDQKKQIVWIVFEGDGERLEANLRGYGVEYAPDFRHHRVGIEFHEKNEHFAEASVEVVSLLTETRPVAKREQAAFLSSLAFVQQEQRERAEAVSC